MSLVIEQNWIKQHSAEIQRPWLIAGPCSAESEQQVLSTAQALKQMGEIAYFRAGVWKPRTRPNSFEGNGSIALSWLKRAKEQTGLKIAVEVATVLHVEEALRFGVDLLWIGARTTAGPFAVQELADSLRGVDVAVMVKNPVNAELALWIGALERFHHAGIKKLGAIHRGFSGVENGIYRNIPLWNQPIELKRLYPQLPIVCDPSHIAGKREFIAEVCQTAIDLALDGLMIEVHPTPEQAMSDSAQQVTPAMLQTILAQLIIKKTTVENTNFADNMAYWRGQIDRLDDEILIFLRNRMQVSGQIGVAKANQQVTVLQSNRWQQLLKQRIERAKELGLSPEFVEKLYQLIHEESVRLQAEILNKVRS